VIAIVAGSARCVHDDLAAACRLVPAPAVIVAVNDMAAQWPGPLEHFVTMHPEHVPKWIRERRAAGLPDPANLWTVTGKPQPAGFTFQPVKSYGGSSSMLATTVALEHLGCRVVLCGVPLLPNEAHFHTPAKRWDDARQFHPAWLRRLPAIRDSVRSMSGWTREKLGAPTAEWVAASLVC